MAINFPDSPSVNDTHTVGDRTWVWDGTVWSVVVGSIPTAITELTITNDLTVDTSTLHVDSTNDRVGIGTTSPEQPLHVNSGTNNTAALLESTDANVRLYMQDSGSTDAQQVGLLGVSDDLRLVAGGGARMSLLSDGKVGIGTTSPGYKLEVDGTIAVTNSSTSLISNNSSSGREVLQLRARTGTGDGAGINLYGDADATHPGKMIFYSDGSGRLTIDGENVGIGTLSPQTLLEVQNGIITSRSGTGGVETQAADKGIALIAGGMNATSKYTPGVLFGSTDSGFSTNNPKYNAGIFGRANQTYNDDSDTAMSIEMMVSGTNAGTDHGVVSTTFGYSFGPSVFHSRVDDATDLGSSSRRWDDIYATNGTIQTSDERDKTNVTDLTLGLAFVDSLRPVSYTWNDRSGYVGTREHMGFVAQEIATALGDDAANTAVWTHTEATEETDEEGNVVETTLDRQGVRYNELIAPMVKAIQELSARVAALEAP